MNTKGIVVIVVFLILIGVVFGYLLLRQGAPQKADEDLSQVINEETPPALGESANPLKNKPDINPVNASNPFRQIKTNPFK